MKGMGTVKCQYEKANYVSKCDRDETVNTICEFEIKLAKSIYKYVKGMKGKIKCIGRHELEAERDSEG
jgi:hypothetical protein